MMKAIVATSAVALFIFLQAPLGSCFVPAKVGHLSSSDPDLSISGLVYLLDRSTVYIKDFDFSPQDSAPGLSLTLKGNLYSHCEDIPISEVGNGLEDSLVCHTDLPTCCRGKDDPVGRIGQGEWYFPDGTVVPRPSDSANSAFYRARGKGQIRLNRKLGKEPVGKYCCRLKNAAGIEQSICVNLVSDSDQSNNQQVAYFCAGYSHSHDIYPLQYDNSAADIPAVLSRPHLHLRLPAGNDIRALTWVGVCRGDSVLAGVAVLPSSTLRLPCEAILLGDLSGDDQGEGVSGRVYLTSRLEIVILCFNYGDSHENDAVILTGTGEPDLDSDILLAVYGNHGTQSLGAIVNQDTSLILPDEAVCAPLSHLTIYSRSRNAPLSMVRFSPELLPPLPPTVPGVRIGTFFRRFHQLAGTAYALNSTSLYIQSFNYDGTGPDVSFRAAQGRDPLSPDRYEDMADETGSYGNLRAYFSEDLTLQLPPDWDVFNTNQIIVWCEQARTSFGEVRFPQGFQLDNYEDIQPPPPTPLEECPPLEPLETGRNCERLDSDLTVSWVLKQDGNQATFQLCGCSMDEEYMAFGPSGSSNFIQMIGSDAVWAWIDDTGPHAQELHFTAYAQCSTYLNSGACPEESDHVTAVSGYEEDCKTCITFTRPIDSNDIFDKPLENRLQQIVWAVGPVGSIATSSGATKPIPFKHYRRSSYTDQMSINFWRAPEDNCGPITCESQCNASPRRPVWRQPVLDHTTDISVRIGQSGGRIGYPSFTGVVGWGIAIYLNKLLIPQTTMYRSRTYTFTVETGNNLATPARYHPFYITDSSRGGYLALSSEAQQEETIYAGVDSRGKFIGVGRFCYYGPNGPDQAENSATFSDYFNTLQLECDPGNPGVFTWTPDEKTPDTVYFQCATHQYLGWKINIKDIPDEDQPISVEVPDLSPMIFGRNFKFDFSTTKTPNSLEKSLFCDGVKLDNFKCFKRFLNSYSCNATLPNTDCVMTIEVLVNRGRSDEFRFTRTFPNFADLMSCGLFTRGTHGVRCVYNSEKKAVVLEDKFFSTGLFAGFICKVNDIETPCDDGEICLSEDGPNPPVRGWNKISIEIVDCEGSESLSEVFCFNSENGEIITAINGQCPKNKN